MKCFLDELIMRFDNFVCSRQTGFMEAANRGDKQCRTTYFKDRGSFYSHYALPEHDFTNMIILHNLVSWCEDCDGKTLS